MKRSVVWLLLLFSNILFAENYEFMGRHYLASYHDCDEESLTNLEALVHAFEEATTASGATILNKVQHVFPGDGITLAILLSESHASLHTYPEHKACFVDLFTCGTTCKSDPFDEALTHYLKPGKKSVEIIDRD